MINVTEYSIANGKFSSRTNNFGFHNAPISIAIRKGICVTFAPIHLIPSKNSITFSDFIRSDSSKEDEGKRRFSFVEIKDEIGTNIKNIGQHENALNL